MKRILDDVQLVRWINGFVKTNKYAPTVREVAEALGVNISTAHVTLSKLRDRGMVEWNEGETRTLRVTKVGISRANARTRTQAGRNGTASLLVDA